MKTCFKCNIEKPLELFYKHPKMGDGRLGKCIECTKNDSKKTHYIKNKDPEWVEKERVRGRKKWAKYKYRSKHTDNEDKKKIRILVQRKGGKNGIELHHWSYNVENAFDTIPLTISSHRYLHARLIYNELEKCYETKSGRLLNTKQLHLDFMKEINIKPAEIQYEKRI